MACCCLGCRFEMEIVLIIKLHRADSTLWEYLCKCWLVSNQARSRKIYGVVKKMRRVHNRTTLIPEDGEDTLTGIMSVAINNNGDLTRVW